MNGRGLGGSGLFRKGLKVKSLSAGVLILSLVALAGCTEGTPGGPGATEVTAKKPVLGLADDTFDLEVPRMSTSLKQGESKEIAIRVSRGKNFDQDVTLKFTGVPKGVSLVLASPVIAHGDKEAKVTLKAADDAALGDFTLKATGEPTKGMPASSELKVTVARK